MDTTEKKPWREFISNISSIFLFFFAIDAILVIFAIGVITSGEYKGGVWFWDVQAKFVLKIIIKIAQFLGLA